MSESVRSRIDKVKKKLRKAKNDGDSTEVGKLREALSALRAQDPLFSREDQYKAAILEGRFAAAAKLKLTIDKMKQENPLRPPAEDDHDPGEDMSWGFDPSFHARPEDDTPEGWMDI
ncbi:hypothetical protein JKP88DRAFT_347363 [Tribonema minus]|uniref:Uncharacterized protein n=1 Tax=Tribonema minus TaxID=303371 RepID=A0A836CMC9_9STRA|nr:hypothetical protein JKP88DRAFT_347363 [Tribonema minus]